MIKPYYHELSDQFKAIQFLKVDVDEQEKIAQEAGVVSMPTFQVYINGEKVDELVGASKSALEYLVRRHVA